MPVGLNKMPEMREKDKNRFFSKILFTANSNRCWHWGASLDTNGYGQFHLNVSYKNGKMFMATRVAYYLHYNIDPIGLAVCHKCDNPKCCNPDHLFLGTLSDNSVDMVRKGRHNKPFGENCKSSKLKESQVLEIREKYKTGLFSQRKLAKEFKVHQTIIGDIVNNQIWKHI
jgi:hypothetical protein